MKITFSLACKKEAILKLKKLRPHCKVGDVISPIKEKWKMQYLNQKTQI